MESQGRLAGRVAVITGTGSGQGRAAAQVFAAAGAKVVGCDINAEGAEETVRLVRSAGREMTSVHPFDLTEREGARKVVNAAVEAHGGIDILYNNAASAVFAPFDELTYEQWSRTLRGELDIIFHVTQEAWPHLAASGHGSIVNIASIAGLLGFGMEPPQTPHSTGKAGVQGMTRQLAVEGRHHGIRVNSISPGFIRTPILDAYTDEPGWIDGLLANQLIKRAGRPEDIAYAALFLSSDEASFITGKDLAVDGGMTSWVCPT